MKPGGPLRRLVTLDALAAALCGQRRDGMDWLAVAGLARALDVRAPLWAVLREDHDGVPGTVVDDLREFARGNTLRNAHLREELREIVSRLSAAGIEPLLIKGALRLVDGSLGRVGDRWLSDLDLMVPREAERDAQRALVAAGYRPSASKPFSHPHETPFHRPGARAPIELHVELGSPPVAAVIPARTAWAESRRLGTVPAWMPSPTHQVLHSVLHSAVQDLNHGVAGLPLRQLTDLVSLADAHGAEVNWNAVHACLADHRLDRVLSGHLWLAHRYAGLTPLGVTWWRAERRLEGRVRLSYALGGVADLRRNIRYAFGREYLDSLYGNQDEPLGRALARARHTARLLRTGHRSVLGAATTRRN